MIKKLIDSDWSRAVQLLCNSAKMCNSVQKCVISCNNNLKANKPIGQNTDVSMTTVS